MSPRARRSPFSSEELSNNSVVLPDTLGGGSTTTYVHYASDHEWLTPLSIGEVLDSGPQSHTFEWRFSGMDFADHRDAGRDAALRDLWTRLSALPGLELVRDVRAREESVTIAKLCVHGYWDDPRDTAGWSWARWTDEFEDEQLGETIEQIVAKEARVLGGVGTAYYFRTLHVHPAFRGQHLGARLLAHALWYLLRSPNDLAIMRVMPIPSEYEPPRGPPAPGEEWPTPPRQAVLGLASYYERLGLWRWPRTARPRGDHPIVLWHNGWSMLPIAPDYWNDDE